MTNHQTEVGACAVQPLADSAVGRVAACPACGQIHLTLQYMTLRLERDAFAELATMVLEAQARLQSRGCLSVVAAPAPSDLEAAGDASLH